MSKPKRIKKQKLPAQPRTQPAQPNLPLIREVGPMAGVQPGAVRYKMGKCRIILAPPYLNMGWHMSISCVSRYPTWEELAHAWYSLVPDADKRQGVMFLPPADEYVNVHDWCFHVHEDLSIEVEES